MLYAEYQERGGKVHPNGWLQTKPWGTKELAEIVDGRRAFISTYGSNAHKALPSILKTV